MEIEKRVMPTEDIELRATGGRHVSGLAIIFNRKSQNLGNFFEIILPSAVDGVIDKSDVLCLLDHDKSRVLARSVKGKGSLSLTPEQRGLRYEFDSPKTSTGDELLEMLKRGDIFGSSFAFTVAPGGDKWEKQTDGSYIRTVHKIDALYDVSPVFSPAYVDTTVAMRRLSEAGGTPVSISQEELERQWEEYKRKEPKQPTDAELRKRQAQQELELAKDIAYANSIKKPHDYLAPLTSRGSSVKPSTKEAKPKNKGKGRKGLFGI